MQSIIAGTKTMFREVIKKTEDEIENYTLPDRCGTELLLSECPYQVGQKIFVKESFREHAFCKHHYKADDEERKWGIGSITKNFLPAKHMKQEHSRLTLEITDIKVERLKEIDIKDVYKEGLPNHRIGQTFMWFEEHWNSTHKKPEEKFEANPWVWVVDFKINK